MPLYDREPRGFTHYARVFGVSKHVIDSARSKGLLNVHDEPLYGVADLSPRGSGSGLEARSPYDADRRKLRDLMVSMAQRAMPRAFATGRQYERVKGALTLGIVSRLTPIKQFPQLFRLIAPIIGRHPKVRLEVFGSGGYASVRDLRKALRPCRSQVRLWGHQPDVRVVYPRVDYVLSGLPEKEALGLNLIEAQACGTPVLAVNKPPFTETVVHGRTGYLFDDPREDGGAGFERLLKRIESALRPDPRDDYAHLAQFSESAFRERVARAIQTLG
jgi:glycosyltransferase involved in cell wall biosynthesis